MDVLMIAPCGLNCALCSGYQRQQDRCGGCNSDSVRPGYCTSCIIKYCLEKQGDNTQVCNSSCAKFPCRRMKDLDKRYRTKYGESGLENIALIEQIGLEAFTKKYDPYWDIPLNENLPQPDPVVSAAIEKFLGTTDGKISGNKQKGLFE